MSNAQARPEFLNALNAGIDTAYTALESTMVIAAAVSDQSDNPLVAVEAAFHAAFAADRHAAAVGGGLYQAIVEAWNVCTPATTLAYLKDFRDQIKGEVSARALDRETRTKYDTVSTYFSLLTRAQKAGFNPADFSGKNALAEACKSAEGKAPKALATPKAPAVSAPGQTEESTPATGNTCQYTQALLMVTAMLKEGKQIEASLQGAIVELLAQAHKSLPVKAIEAAFQPATM